MDNYLMNKVILKFKRRIKIIYCTLLVLERSEKDLKIIFGLR